MTRSEYLALRRRYHPDTTRLLLVAESPPSSGAYFYNPAGARTEPLFAALATAAGISPATKEEGLRALAALGWLLVDATYEPVNDYPPKQRDAVIARDYLVLREDLLRASPERTAPVILIKANVCRLLEPRLAADGFRVLNAGSAVYFPSHGRQLEFHRQFGAILARIE